MKEQLQCTLETRKSFQEQHHQSLRVLRLDDVREKTGLSRSSIYLKEKNGAFPKHISLGVRLSGWLESEVDAWIAERVAASRTKGAAA